MGKAEAKIQSDVTIWLESIGCKVINTVALSKSGNADLIICWKGYYVEMEIKVPGDEARPLQVVKGQWTIDADGAWFCIHSLDEAKDSMSYMKQIKGVM